MIPNNAISAISLYGAFLAPDNKRPRLSRKSSDTSSYGQCLDALPRDWEIGGIAISNTSKGLNYQTWEFRREPGSKNIQVSIENSGAWITLHTATGVVSEVVGCFDSNMSPVVAWVEDGLTHLRYYNSLIGNFSIMTLAGCDSPRLSLDDKRPTQNGNADALLFYIKADALYYRQQRDRYATERYLRDCPPNTLRLGRVGMGTTNRVQIEFLTVG